jgi:hypothetical protein
VQLAHATNDALLTLYRNQFKPKIVNAGGEPILAAWDRAPR